MQKKDFMQRAAIQFMPHVNFKIGEAIRYGERLWELLTERGYGAPDPTGPRETINWYKKLTAYQREWFDRFWKAFNHKHARNQAAMSWQKLGELTKAEYQQIVSAAGEEARRPRDAGATRKMAQGWLSERRWEDITETPGEKSGNDKAADLRELSGELAALKRLNKANPNDTQEKQIKQIQAKFEALHGHQR